MEAFQAWFAGLTESEQRLMKIMGAVAVVMLVALPIYFMASSIRDIEEENRDIVDVLKQIRQKESALVAERKLQEQEAERFKGSPPELPSLLSEKAQKQELSLTQITEQPNKKVGKYERKHVRADLPNISLNAGLKFVDSISRNNYPLAIEKLQIEHFRQGQDQYNFQLGVITFEKSNAKDKKGDS